MTSSILKSKIFGTESTNLFLHDVTFKYIANKHTHTLIDTSADAQADFIFLTQSDFVFLNGHQWLYKVFAN